MLHITIPLFAVPGGQTNNRRWALPTIASYGARTFLSLM